MSRATPLPRAYDWLRLASLVGLLWSTTAMAADIQSIMTRLQNVLGPLTELIMMICYVFGIGMVFRGLGLLKAFGMPLTQAARPGEIGGPLVYIVVGSVLIWVPHATNIASTTIFGTQVRSLFNGANFNYKNMGAGSIALMGYTSIQPTGNWAAMFDTVTMYIQFIGFLAFVRGWFILAHAGQPGVQPGTIPKAIVHVIGGILAVNFVPLVEILNKTIYG